MFNFNFFKRIALFFLLLLLPVSIFSQNYHEISERFAKESKQFIEPKLNSFSVLDVSFEGGPVYLQKLEGSGDIIRINMGKSGGMGTVVPPTAEAISRYAVDKNLNVSMNTVSPYLCGPMCETNLEKLLSDGYLARINTFTVKVDGKDYKVEAYAGRTSYNGKQYLLSCPELWDGYFGEKGNPFRYTATGNEVAGILNRNFESIHGGGQDLISLRAYIGFSQATAKLFETIKADVAIINDYHPALSLFYTEMPALLIGHNLAFHGIIGVNNKEVPYWDHNGALDYLSRLTNLPKETIDRYFRIWNSNENIGAASVMKAAILKLGELTGIGLVAVSEQYAEELKMDYFQTRDRIMVRNPELNLSPEYFYDGPAIERITSFYRSLGLNNFDAGNASSYFVKEESRGLKEIRDANIVGVVNGQDQILNPETDPKLKDIVKNPSASKFFNQESINFLTEIGNDPYFKNGLNFSMMDPERFFKAKQVIRKLLLMEFFPNNPEIWNNTESFIVYNFGRMTDQKGTEILYSKVDQITANGDIVIIVGTEPGGMYEQMADVMSKKADKMQKEGKYFAFTSRFTPYYYVYGADIKVTPSFFEPCGMTPAEANRGGVPVIVSDVGGLQRFQDAFMFKMVHSDPWTSANNLYEAYLEARNEWYNNRSSYEDRMQRVALKDYSYEKPASLYIELLLIALTKTKFNDAITVAEAYSQGLVDYEDYKRVKDAVMALPEWLREAYVKYATRFSSYDKDKAFFFGVSNSTIEGLFSSNKDVESPVSLDANASTDKPEYANAVVDISEKKISGFERSAIDFTGQAEKIFMFDESKGDKKDFILDLCVSTIVQKQEKGESIESIIRSDFIFFAEKGGFIEEYIKTIPQANDYQDMLNRLNLARFYVMGLNKVVEADISWFERVDELKQQITFMENQIKMPRDLMLINNFKEYYKKTYGLDLKETKMEDLFDKMVVEGVKDLNKAGAPSAEWLKMMCGTEAENYQDGLLYYLKYRADNTADIDTRAERQFQFLTLSRRTIFELSEQKINPEHPQFKTVYERSIESIRYVRDFLNPNEKVGVEKTLREEKLKEINKIELDIKRSKERTKTF